MKTLLIAGLLLASGFVTKADQVNFVISPVDPTEYNFLKGPNINGILDVQIGPGITFPNYNVYGPQSEIISGSGEINGVNITSVSGGYVDDFHQLSAYMPVSIFLANGTMDTLFSTNGGFWAYELDGPGWRSEVNVIDPPVATPEPPSGLLMALGLGLVLIVGFWREYGQAWAARKLGV